MATQFDIIRSQTQGAVRNAAAREEGKLRRETSLVNAASRWAGKAMVQGEAELQRRKGVRRGARPAGGETQCLSPGPVRPAPDGYVRRSPVQPLHAARDYRRRQVLRAVAIAAVAAAACAGIYFLNQLGVFGR